MVNMCCWHIVSVANGSGLDICIYQVEFRGSAHSTSLDDLLMHQVADIPRASGCDHITHASSFYNMVRPPSWDDIFHVCSAAKR